jgi:hypothetical protein
VKRRIHELIRFSINEKVPMYFMRTPVNSCVVHTYPTQIVDTLKGGDSNLFVAKMRSICSPEIELILEYSEENNPFGPNNRQFSGLNHVIGFFLAYYNSAPDVLFEIVEPVLVHRKSDDETTSSCKTDELTTTTNTNTCKYLMHWKLLMSHTRTKVLVDHIDTHVAVPIAYVSKKSKLDYLTPPAVSLPPPTITTTTTDAQPPLMTTKLNDTNNDTKQPEINNLLKSFESFTVTPITPHNTFAFNHFVCEVNADMKVTKMCGLFCYYDTRPTQFKFV